MDLPQRQGARSKEEMARLRARDFPSVPSVLLTFEFCAGRDDLLLSGEFGYEIGAGVACGEQCGDDGSPVGRDVVAVGSGNLADEAVAAQERQLAGYRCGMTALLLGRGRIVGKEQLSQVAIAEAVEGEL